jgi:hypothetical protein
MRDADDSHAFQLAANGVLQIFIRNHKNNFHYSL